MKALLPVVFLFVVASAYGQQPQFATATRASNGHLISISNILGLSDCPTAEFTGKVSHAKLDGEVVRFRLYRKEPTKKKMRIEVNLGRIAPTDRTTLFSDLVQDGRTLRVAGYSCNDPNWISAISIDLVYHGKPTVQKPRK
jgi:hypothetical protein